MSDAIRAEQEKRWAEQNAEYIRAYNQTIELEVFKKSET